MRPCFLNICTHHVFSVETIHALSLILFALNTKNTYTKAEEAYELYMT